MTYENDQTLNMATPAVIIAAIRSGGTFLAHCLSNHSQIFCARGEPLHYQSQWQQLSPDRRQLLALLLNQTGYQVSMCKATYVQALNQQLWTWLVARQPRIIWLRRENVIRQAVSVLINQAARAGSLQRPQHTFTPLGPLQLAQVTLSPALVLKAARGLRAQDQQVATRLADINIQKICRLTYTDVVGGEGLGVERLPAETSARLGKFLGVHYERLGCELQRINDQPLRELLANWRELVPILQESEFSQYLEDEWTTS